MALIIFTSSLLGGYNCPDVIRICSLDVGVEAPKSTSELCEVGMTGAILMGEGPLSMPSTELSTQDCTLWCLLHGLTKYTITVNALSPISTI